MAKRPKQIIRTCAEFYGTFLLAFAVSVSRGSPIAIASTLWLCIHLTRMISGGQFNPAVTIGLTISHVIKKSGKKKLYQDYSFYVVAQILGGILGGLLGWGVDEEGFEIRIGEDYTLGQAFIGELIFTSILVSNATMVGEYPEGTVSSSFSLFLSVLAGGYAIGPISGACMNPAIAIGINGVYGMDHDDNEAGDLWLYLLAPSLGGVVSGVLNVVFLRGVKSTRDFVLENDDEGVPSDGIPSTRSRKFSEGSGTTNNYTNSANRVQITNQDYQTQMDTDLINSNTLSVRNVFQELINKFITVLRQVSSKYPIRHKQL